MPLSYSKIACLSSYNINAAPRTPTTAPKISRGRICAGTAAPGEGAGGAPVDAEPVGLGVALLEREPELVGELVLTVPLLEPVEEATTDSVVEGCSTLKLLLLLLLPLLLTVLDTVLDAVLDELEEGWSTIRATMRTSVHWSPMERS